MAAARGPRGSTGCRGCGTIEPVPTDYARLHAVFDLAMRIGEGMLTNGAAASEVSATVLRVTSSSGLRNVAVQVTFDEVSISYLADETSAPFTRIRAATSRTQDFGRLAAFERVTMAYVAGDLDLEDARRAVMQIPQNKPLYSNWLVAAGFAVLGGGAAFGLGAGTLVMAAATIAGGLLILVAGVFGRRGIPIFYTQAASGFIGVACAVVVDAIDPTVNSSIVVVSCIIVMLAGLTSISAMQDAITGWYVTASGRILETLMLTVGLVFGVRGGILLADAVGADISVSATLPVSLVSAVVLGVSGAAIGLGYAVGSQVPGSMLGWATAIAVISSVISHLMTVTVVDRVNAVALTAFLVGVLSVVLGDRLRGPALIFVMCGVIPLVPGMRIYRGLLALSDDVVSGAVELFSAGEIAVAIAAGAVIGQIVAARVIRVTSRSAVPHVPVIAAPFTTLRRRRASLAMPWRRRRGQIARVEPSTMTGEMTALTPAMLEQLEQIDGTGATDPEET